MKTKTKTNPSKSPLKKPRGKALKPAKIAVEPKPTAEAKKSESTERNETKESKSFVRGLLLRGEALPLSTPENELPPGATHVIVEDEKGGSRKVKRVRFSMG